MRFIITILSTLALAACQSNPPATPLPDLPPEISELGPDDVEVIYAAIHDLIVGRYVVYREQAEQRGHAATPIPTIVLVERTIKTCEVPDYNPVECLSRHEVTRIGSGALERLVDRRNRRSFAIAERPGSGVALTPVELSPLAGRGLWQWFHAT